MRDKAEEMRRRYRNAAANTEGMLDALGSNLILHIPHASSRLEGEYLIDMEPELARLTDTATDLIFDVDRRHRRLLFPYSRFLCDVERLDDSREPLAKEEIGRGIFYTRNLEKQEIRKRTPEAERRVMELYREHHARLNELTAELLENYGGVIVIDCHSFGDDITDNGNPQGIEICLGWNPEVLKSEKGREVRNFAEQFFRKEGFVVGVNEPYGYSVVPSDYTNDDRVISVMVEINKKLYMKAGKVVDEKVEQLNGVMTRFTNHISLWNARFF